MLWFVSYLCYRHQNIISIIFCVSHKYKIVAYTVNAEVEVNKSLHKSLIMLPVIILNMIFCILKLFALCEESHQYINPQFIIE
jgi:hypothetical protein